MPLKDLLRKKDRKDDGAESGAGPLSPPPPEFTFMRTTTTTQEYITPPDHPGDQGLRSPQPEEKRRSIFHRRHSNNPSPAVSDDDRSSKENRLSRLHLGSRSRPSSPASPNLPPDLPSIPAELAKSEEDEAQWEKRATLLAQGNPLSRSGSTANVHEETSAQGNRPRSRSVGVGDDESDVCFIHPA